MNGTISPSLPPLTSRYVGWRPDPSTGIRWSSPLRAITGLWIALLLSIPAMAQDSNGRLVRFHGTTMGSIEWNVSVVLSGSTPGEDELRERSQEVLDGLNSRMSTWIPDSEVSRFNAADSTGWFPVSGDTSRVVSRAIEISSASGGAFDITVLPLVELWNFGKGRGEFVLPPAGRIGELREHVGWHLVEVRAAPPAIRKLDPAVRIDLSGIAKGLAVDLVAAALRDAGVRSYFVEVGGEVAAAGRKPEGGAWRIGIERPLDSGRDVQLVITLDGRAMATSGDYRNVAVIDGRRYSHTIDPATGWPVEHDLASVSVVASDCMTADAAATALMVAGPQRLREVARALGVEALGLVREGSDFRELKTPGFPAPQDAQPASRTANWRPMVLTGILFGLALAGMAVGAIFANRPLRGSCGGIGSSGECGTCGGSKDDCGT